MSVCLYSIHPAQPQSPALLTPLLMQPRPLSSQSVPWLTERRLIFSMAFNGKHMHSREQREEICDTFQNSPIWHTARLLRTVQLSVAQWFQFSVFIYLFILERWVSGSGSSGAWSVSRQATMMTELQFRHNGLLIHNENHQQVRIGSRPQTAAGKTKKM